MTNNAAEQSIRPFTLGRKNWYLIDTIGGAKSSAIAYSIAETAKANNLKPYEYFKYLLEELPKHGAESPYMLLVANVLKPNEIPAVTHVDKTARVQTITSTQNAVLYNILDEFEKLSGVPILLNTSFNIAGEPIVETPMDALKCFEKTNLDALSIGPYLITKDVKKGKIEIDNYQRFVVSLGAAL